MTVSSKHLVVGAAALSLLLAPASPRAAAPAGRYAPSGGVVLDRKTGLNWQQVVAPATYTWADAVAYCSSNVATLPGSGWRLPAIKELQTLVDDSVASPGPTIDTSAFPSTPAGLFWSSTLYALDPSFAWLVHFGRGSTNDTALNLPGNVRCVR